MLRSRCSPTEAATLARDAPLRRYVLPPPLPPPPSKVPGNLVRITPSMTTFSRTAPSRFIPPETKIEFARDTAGNEIPPTHLALGEYEAQADRGRLGGPGRHSTPAGARPRGGVRPGAAGAALHLPPRQHHRHTRISAPRCKRAPPPALRHCGGPRCSHGDSRVSWRGTA